MRSTAVLVMNYARLAGNGCALSKGSRVGCQSLILPMDANLLKCGKIITFRCCQRNNAERKPWATCFSADVADDPVVSNWHKMKIVVGGEKNLVR